MKALKIAGIVVGSVVVLVLVLAGIAYGLLRAPSGIASNVTPVPTSAAAEQQFDAKVDAFESAVERAAPGTELTLTLTQEEINSKIAAELSQADIPENMDVSNVSVNLKDGQVLASANVNYNGIAANVGILATVTVVDGKAKVTVQDIDMGKVPIPQALKDQITGLIPQGGTFTLSDQSLALQDIQVVDGQIVLKGVKR